MEPTQWKRIEAILLHDGLVKEWQLLWAAHEHLKTGEPIARILIQAGHLDPVAFALAVAANFGAGDGNAAAPAAKLFAFFPAKGGSGSTFLAVNTALGLAQDGGRVLLADLDFLLPNAILHLGIPEPGTSVCAIVAGPPVDRFERVREGLIPCGPGGRVSLLTGPKRVGELDSVTPAQVAAILDLSRPEFDFIVVDLPGGLDEAALAVFDRADRICPVFTPSFAGIANASKVLSMFRVLAFPETKVCPVVSARRDDDLAAAAIDGYLGYKVGRVVGSHPERVERAISGAAPPILAPDADALYNDLATLVNALAGRNACPTRAVSGFWDRVRRIAAESAGRKGA